MISLQSLLVFVALFILCNLIIGLWRVLRGPSDADRMLAAQLFGTSAVAILVVLAEANDNASFRDIALLFSLLAAIAAVAFVRRAWPAGKDTQ